MRFLESAGRFAYFLVDFGRAMARRPPSLGAILEEAFRIGVRSLPVLLVIAVFVGTNLALQGANAFAQLGGQNLVGTFVAMAGVREMAPVIAAAMIAAKAGTEMASQIAVMRIREQIDALEVMAVNPLWYLVAPRLLGIVLVLPALTILAIFVTLLASWAVVVLQLGQSGAVFLAEARATVTGADLAFSMVKGLAFGVIIALVSCFFGFQAGRGPEGVGRATNAAVVTVSVAVVCLNYLLSVVFYG
ncbi:MAG: ABC transporter permease [Deltaproteobacteria bacterium]|nr:ABC transporter permease [Deltaproteobacteria bacterium]